MSQAIQRQNPQGQRYTLIAKGQFTEIHCHRNKEDLVVNTTLDALDRAWADWVDRGHFIHNAFPFLSEPERAFLMTGVKEER